MPITANDLRKGMIILFNNELCQVVEVEFVRPGNWRAMAQTKLRSVKTGAIFQQRFQTTEKVEEAAVETRTMQFLYATEHLYYFMDVQTYDQIEMNEDFIGDNKKFLKEQMEVVVKLHEGKPIGIELPSSVELEVIETSPNIRGNTASGGGKPATLEGGHVTTVPFFVEVGERVRVDTRTGEYLERVGK
ncbi:MAG: Translation elongation factor P [Candidatus Ozemobacter sibiricus]|jgi:elongation factor P|uniref:Elongation factor P n=1 Tax=Candidatus Ozemobacter sibiricus TaxID=2268124 RepID=A0A367ZN24_9BACT|nr:MAG: Translation elongation factor P [Candidatus Ozemobacter sibiricus]